MTKIAREIAYYSRSRGALWALAAAILGGGMLLAWALGERAAAVDESPRGRVAEAAYGGGEALGAFAASVEDRRFGLWECLEAMPVLANVVPEARWPEARLALEGRFGGEAAALAMDFLEASFGQAPEARARLEERASAEPPVRFANRILARLALSRNLKQEAARFYAREGVFAEAVEERREAVGLYWELDDLGMLRRLAGEPRYQDALDDWVMLGLAVEARDWLSVTRLNLTLLLDEVGGPALWVTAVAGAVWSIVLLQLGQGSGGMGRSLGLAGAALVLGVASGVPTLVANSMLVSYFDFDESGVFLRDLGFYVLSVGLREEVCKLLAFVPLGLYVARRGDELEMLTVAGFVGLGFAIGENFTYLESSLGGAAPGRFLTANFFHIGMTGLSGLYFCRSFAIRGYDWSHFLYVFGLVVVAHGLYNALLSLPEFGDFSFLAYTVYILLSLRFFAEAHQLREPSNPVVSFSAVFTAGACLVVVSALLYMTREMGFGRAFDVVGPEALSVGLIAVMFFREFREELHA